MSAPSEAAAGAAAPKSQVGAGARSLLWGVMRVVVPVLLALLVSAVALILLGKDPLVYYGYIVERGLFNRIGLQETIIRMAPLLLIAAGLIVAFQAGIWNLGGDGQFLLAAVVTAALGPALITILPLGPTLIICMLVGMLVGALWSVIPALLKARYGVNEIITSLMMSFLGTSLANVLIKLPFADPATTVPQTRTLPVDDRLPRLFGTAVHSGILVALAAVVLVHLMMTRTAFGLKLQVVGANPRAAMHAGLDVAKLTIATFAISAGLIGLGGAVEILGVWGTVRADWNPAFGMLVVPLVFLARFNGIAVIGFTFFFAMLMIGAESASRRVGIPQHYVLVLVALVLLFLALVDYIGQRWPRTKA